MGSFVVYDRTSAQAGQTNMMWATFRTWDDIWPKNGAYYSEELEFYDGSDLVIYTPEFQRFLRMIGLSNEQFEDNDYDDIDSAWFEIEEPPMRAGYGVYPDLESTLDPQPDFTPEEAYSQMPDNEKIKSGNIVKLKVYYGGKMNKVIPGDNYQSIDQAFTPDFENPENPNVVDPVVTSEEAMTVDEIVSELLQNPGLHMIGNMPRIKIISRRMTSTSNGSTYKAASGSAETTILGDGSYDKYNPAGTIDVSCGLKYGYYALFDVNNTTFERVSTTPPKRILFDANLNSNKQYGFTFEVTFRAISDLTPQSECMTTVLDLFNLRKEYNRKGSGRFFKQLSADYRLVHPVNNPSQPSADVAAWPWEGGRLSVEKTRIMRKHDWIPMIGDGFGYDYEVAEPSFWESVAGVVVIAIGIAITILTAGAIKTKTFVTGIVKFAFAFGLGAGAMQFGGAMIAMFGGRSAYSVVKEISKVAQVFGATSAILGFVALFSSAWKSVTRPKQTPQNLENASLQAKSEAVAYGDVTASEAFTATEMASSKTTEALLVADVNTFTPGELAIPMMETSSNIYQNYNQNVAEARDAIAEAKGTYADLVELSKLNAYNESKNWDVLGDASFTYSLGSYDAIAELDIKTEQMIGDNMQLNGPALGGLQ